MAITPFKAAEKEGFGVQSAAAGTRRCIVIAPSHPAEGNPWSWRGCYWDHQPQTEIELLRRGFHVAYISADEKLRPDKHWDAWYDFLTEKHGLSRKPAFIGMSRGGEFSYIWATTHPDKVTCIYADNPGCNWDIMAGLPKLATNDVPLLHICGSFDPIMGKFSLAMEDIYRQYGGRISMMIKEGRGHHPHSLKNPRPIADFIERSFNETKPSPPDFVGKRFTRTSYYSSAGSYRDYLKDEGTFITCRGPFFTDCYDRYELTLGGVEAFSTVIIPKTPAPGNPWAFRADFVTRDDVVAQALLAKGFYIVTGAVPYNGDGPNPAQWDTIYKHFTDAGFAARPVMLGNGGAAGEAYAWAEANPDKVSAIYAQNPYLHSQTAKTQPLDDLAPLAKAGVPLLHVCGSLDPWYRDNTQVMEQRYKDLGGKITVIVKEGQGHYQLAPDDAAPVVDFLTQAVK